MYLGFTKEAWISAPWNTSSFLDPDYPAESDVKAGVHYGNGDYAGTLPAGRGGNSCF